MFQLNPLHKPDSYKLGHAVQMPEDTEFVYEGWTPRSNRHLAVPEKYKTNKHVNFGIQSTIRGIAEEWDELFFKKDFDQVSKKFLKRIKPFMGDNVYALERLKYLHDLGYLPLTLKALPEGYLTNIGVPTFTVVNTDKNVSFLVGYLENQLSNESWKIATVATIADRYREILEDFAEQTGSAKEFIAFQGHDFALRGMSGGVDGAKSGSGHGISFNGSDNLGAVDFLEYYYGAEDTFVFASVPATEHMVMCLGGQAEEKNFIKRLITEIYPTGIVSIVSDTWNFWKVIGQYAKELKDVILARQPDSMGFAKLVFRPDSGVPEDIITGHAYTEVETLDDYYELLQSPTNYVKSLEDGKYYKLNPYDNGWTTKFEIEEVEEHIIKGAVEVLWDIFGGTVNDKGYKTLNQRVGVIYGDSITMERAISILQRLKDKGFAADNIVLGIGSYTYNFITRDTLGFAMKATYGVVAGQVRELFKDPITDDGTKRSAKGLMRVEKEGTEFVLYDQQTPEQEAQGELRTIFKNGEFFNVETLETIRARYFANRAELKGV